MRLKFLNLDVLKLLLQIFFLSVVFLIFMVVYFPNFAKLKQLRQANAQLLNEITELNKEIKDLRESNKKLPKDSALYEKMAREDLGSAKQGEIVIDIEE